MKKQCDSCGKNFTGNKKKRFCSTSCRVDMHYARKHHGDKNLWIMIKDKLDMMKKENPWDDKEKEKWQPLLEVTEEAIKKVIKKSRVAGERQTSANKRGSGRN